MSTPKEPVSRGAMTPCGELTTAAVNENLPQVLDFIEERLAAIDCPPKAGAQIAVCAEEIFVNIANYAYAPQSGAATVSVAFAKEPRRVAITFRDGGKPFDPTAKADPDITLGVEERDIGGLGIFMTKKLMDGVRYAYIDGQNTLTLEKNL